MSNNEELHGSFPHLVIHFESAPAAAAAAAPVGKLARQGRQTVCLPQAVGAADRGHGQVCSIKSMTCLRNRVLLPKVTERNELVGPLWSFNRPITGGGGGGRVFPIHEGSETFCGHQKYMGIRVHQPAGTCGTPIVAYSVYTWKQVQKHPC